MALLDPYLTRTELKSQISITDTVDDTRIDLALDAASRSIEADTGRQFNLDSGVTSREYYSTGPYLLLFDDISTAAGFVLKTDNDDDGVFETTWAASDYKLEPLNGMVYGVPGRPYCRARAVGAKSFPIPGIGIVTPGVVSGEFLNLAWPQPHRRPQAQVTATFGWASVPGSVKQACALLANEMLKLKDAPFGVVSFQEYGAARVRENPKIVKLLKNYRRNTVVFA